MVKYKMQVKNKNGVMEDIVLAGMAVLGEDGKVPPSQLPALTAKIFEIVSTLPTTGQKENVIYLLPEETSTTTPNGISNTYKEYAWINGKWETLGGGSTEVSIDKATILKLLGMTDVELQTLIAFAKKTTVANGLVTINSGVKADYLDVK